MIYIVMFSGSCSNNISDSLREKMNHIKSEDNFLLLDARLKKKQIQNSSTQ